MYGHFGSHPHRARHSRHGVGGHGGHGDGHGRRGGPRLGRFLEHGDLRFVLLALVEEAPSHGYELIRTLEERTGGAYRPSPGAIYPTLALLEDEGFVAQSQGSGARKLYEITPAGLEALAPQRPSVAAIFARMNETGDEVGRHKVRRGMENVKTALRLRASRGLSETEAEAVAAILDEAAGKIERVGA
ncbi:PadR family transcriptional regulator [Phenylobacterium sp.]|uniref:PadR family transcriptional regulator n=1 Tax=Phenylobacterium sp. TaxID=1871053 RepID=UPI002731A910|nr:PadR family transcriptional regulator [Phenylobacterium sp.]MDP1872732.1 PadR family transcriptional regulator [Phenylobacterium sp.]